MKQTRTCMVAFVLALVAISHPNPLLGQATRLADLNPGATGSYPSNLIAYGDSLVFGAYTQATGFELWRFNGSSIQLIADINNTSNDIGGGVRVGNDSLTAWLTPYNGFLYFSAYEPRRGAELWRYDGSTVSRVTDISPDLNDTIKPLPNSSWPSQLMVFKNNIYFSANSGTVSTNYELWRYDGMTATRVANIHPDGSGDQSSYPSGLTVFNDALYFMANDGLNGYELWKHDGAQTVMLANINPGGPDSSSFPKEFTELNGYLYFQAYTEAAGYELWRTDGTTVSLAADIQSGPESSAPNGFTVFNGALYFMANDGIAGYELWRYNGSTAALVTDINSIGDSFPKNFITHGNALYFVADDGVHGWELWKYDGTTSSLVHNLNPFGDSLPEELTAIGSKLFFVAETPEAGREIWSFDGTNVVLASDTNPGSGSSFPQFLTLMNNQLFFRAAGDGLEDFELWRLLLPNEAPPTITINSPAPGATFLSNSLITMEATATDDAGIARVEFFANGVSQGVVSTPPYAVSVTLAPGNYTLTAIAVDDVGNSTTSVPVQITVTTPNQPPVVSVSSPISGTTYDVAETITIQADASDDSGVAQVEFFANGTSIGTDLELPYAVATTLAVGNYSITAAATDISGVTVISAPVEIAVSAGNQSPTITLSFEPADPSLLPPATVTLRAIASDPDGTIAKVDFYQENVLLGSASAAPYQWVVPDLPAGTYSFRAIASDNSGGTQASSIIQIMVADRPIITAIQKSDQGVTIDVAGPPNGSLDLVWTSDFQTWHLLGTQTSSTGSFSFTDSSTEPHRFYRAALR